MSQRVIVLTGPIASGKSTLAKDLASRFGFQLIRTKDWLKTKLGPSGLAHRWELQRAGGDLDQATDGAWVVDLISHSLRASANATGAVIDAARTPSQVKRIRAAYGRVVTHIHLTAPIDTLIARYCDRSGIEISEGASKYEEARADQTEAVIEELSPMADISIDAGRCTRSDVLTRAVCALGLLPLTNSGYVDVIVGGQFGSEGKGQIAAYLAPEYDLLVRVGGPNAGHKVYEEPLPYTHHQLPSGTRRHESASLLIGPGAVLDVEKLLIEIAECQVVASRLTIDPKAMVIDESDKELERDLVDGIGSTGQGVGAATARRIMGRNDSTKLAKDVPELSPYTRSGVRLLEEVFARNGRVCLEGTQGTGLSVYHGPYPYVTSRDTTASGCLAEAGVAPSKVRRIVMVCRTYPIRVQSPEKGTSGPMSQEIGFETISARSGISSEELRANEMTSTTGRQRRIGEFDWSQLRESSLLNQPTDIALTFTDYLSNGNLAAMRFDQLTPETINFIEEVERVSGARVSLVGTGFNLRSIIDRRNW